jgi:formylglycine-generating enzyme required for sulfatase activity
MYLAAAMFAVLVLGLSLPSTGSGQDVGYVQIECDPGIKIFLDGKFVGVSNADVGGLILQDVTPGRRTIRAALEGYRPQTVTIDVEAGREATLTLRLFVPEIKISETGETQHAELALRVGSFVVQSLPIECSIRIPALDLRATKTRNRWQADDVPVGIYEIIGEGLGKKLDHELAVVEGETTELMFDFIDGTVVEKRVSGPETEEVLERQVPEPAEYVEVPRGTFQMGSPPDEPGRDGDETQHTVTLTTAFVMQSTEVTNAQYAELAQWAVDNGHATATISSLRDALDGSPRVLLGLDAPWCEISYTGGQFVVDTGRENHPVVAVSWYGAVAYCDWLSLREGLPRAYDHSTWTVRASTPYAAQGYRLPTEAEWEYACRAGTDTAFNNGTDCSSADREANYDGDRPLSGCPSGIDRGETIEVASLPAGENDFGLYDMHGNVWEWCNDWYGSYGGDETDPVGESSGTYRVFRGGSWKHVAQYCRSASRNGSLPDLSYLDRGFRPVRSAF